MKTKTISGLLAALFALCLSSSRAADAAEAVQTLPHGQLYELRELDLNKAQCRERVIARGSLEGVYEGEECGEGCSAVIRLDSGEKAYLGSDCYADRLYGPKGRRVVAHFEVRRFWYEYEEQGARGCSEMMVCVAPPAAASAPAAPAGYLLSGTLKNQMADDRPDESFVLKITPGDAPGTWKRARLDTAPKSTGTTP